MATAASIVGTGTWRSMASWDVHFPVPFCFATSRIMSTRRLPVAIVRLQEDVGGDLHQVAASSPPFHSLVDRVQPVVVETQPPLHQIVGLGDELHQAVLDPVVDHLHVVPGRTRSELGHAGLAVHLGRDRLEDRSHPLVGLPGRPASCSGRSARPSRRPRRRRRGSGSLRQGLARRSVSVKWSCPRRRSRRPFEVGDHSSTTASTGLARRHQHHHGPRRPQQAEELLDALRALHRLGLPSSPERLHLGGSLSYPATRNP